MQPKSPNLQQNDERIMELVERAMERPATERTVFLELACESDPSLLQTVLSYVQKEERMGDFMRESLIAPAPDIKSVLHYEIEGVLGQGGQAKVYKAWDKNLKRHVALKFLPPYLQIANTERERFLREATCISSLDHPNIATVHAIEHTTQGMFIVMPCYEGQSLRERIDGAPLEQPEAIALSLQIASGLAAAHDAGVVHRDLKPSNIILTKQGLVKIIDFGVAKVDGSSRLTESGTRIGTVSYMSPEQAMGEQADHRTDLWSLGVLLFEMITGVAPFRGENSQKILHGILHDSPPPLTQAKPTTRQVVSRLLSKTAAQRYQTSNEVIQALRDVQNESEEETVTVARRAKTLFGHLDRRVVLAAMLALAMAAVWGVRAWQGGGTLLSHHANYVAILPFSAQAQDPAEQALANGLSAAVADALRRYEPANPDFLLVRPADIQAQKVTDTAGARKAFGVAKTLTAELVREQGRIRVVLTLVDAVRQRPEASVTVTGTENTIYPNTMDKTAQMLQLRPSPAAGMSIEAGSAAWLRGMGYLERYDKPGNIDAAIAEFEKALQNGSDPLALVGLSEAYRLRFDTTKDPQWLAPGLDYASRAIAQNQDLPQAWAARGAVRNQQNDYKGAVDDFQRSLLLDGRVDRAYRGMGLAFEGMGLKDRAEETYLRAVQILPDYPPNHSRLGSFYYRMGRFKEAETEYRRFIQLVPDSAIGYANLSAPLISLGRFSEAMQALQQSVSINPTWSAYSNLGGIFRRQKSYKEAAMAYEKALEFNKTSYMIWANLAGTYLHIDGQREKAMDAYRHASDLAEVSRKQSPFNGLLLSHLATYDVQLGKRAEPLEMVQQALSVAPRDINVLVNAAEVYESLGFRQQALDSLATAIKLGFPTKDLEDTLVFQDLMSDSRFKAMVAALK